MSTTRLLFAAAIALGAGAAWPQTPEPKPEPLSAFPQSLLAVKTEGGRVVNFKIWLADSQRREEQGLMYIHNLDVHTGMLFMFPGDQRVTMWMRNTYIPLDLLFLDARGKIDYIAASATPMSDTIIGPDTPEFAVLELKGGACDAFGIKVGDLVVHKNFKHAR
ncbi:MAG TPA: DUF192 domain-containing protein [Steroidobacteraceae bacterium]|jgi:hypothetical protein|nr:DUF192 domain-containing protein [Steroidobacteraceae bacterium]